MMNVVIINTVIDSFTPTHSGTTGTITWELCRAAQRTGVEPTVITRREKAAATTFDWSKTIQIDWPNLPKGKLGNYILRAQRKLTGWQHFREGEFCRRLVRAIREAGLETAAFILQNDVEPAVYLREHFPKAFILHHFQNQQWCRPQFQHRLKDAANVVTACSGYTARWIEKFYGFAPNSVKTVYNGVDPERFCPAQHSSNGHPVINFIGRTGHDKAPDLVLKAARVLARRGLHDFGVQILGSNHGGGVVILDDYQKEMRQIAAELEQFKVPVRFGGNIVRADVPDEIRKAHIHVVPSRWEEPCSLAILEGMVCGLATVGSITGGTPEVIESDGFLFERDNPEDLADKLEPLLRDSTLRAEYARRGRARAQVRTWDATWRGLFSCLPA